MQKITKKLHLFILMVFLLSGLGNYVKAQYEPFTGTGTLNTNNGWNSHSGTANQVQRVSGSLSYTGLAASSGDKVQILSTQNEDLNKSVGSVVSSGSFYASALIRVADVSKFQANTANGEYFLHFVDQSGATFTSPQFSARLYVRQGSAANKFQLGITRMSGGTITATDIYGASPTDLDINTTYLVVIKYDFTAVSASLFINPTPGAAEPAATKTTTLGTSTVTDIEAVCIRNSNATTAPIVGTGDIEIDELRWGTTWASVTPASAVATPTLTATPTSLSGFTTTAGTASAEQSYALSGSDLTGFPANITVTAPTGYEVSLTSGSGFAASVNVPYTSASLASTTIYVRIASSASAGAANGNVSNAGGGATTVNVALTGTVNPSGGPTITAMNDIRQAIDANGAQVAPYAVNTDVTVEGKIIGVNRNIDGTVANGTKQKFEFTVVDYSGVRGGLVIRSTGTTDIAPSDLQEGDSVTVVGKVGQFNGLTQVSTITSVTRIATGKPRGAITTVTVLDEDAESKLVRLEGVSVTSWPASWTGSAQNANITVGANTYTLRITSASELWNKTVEEVFGVGATVPVSNVTMIGLGGQFDNSSPYTVGYQIFVYKLADIFVVAPSGPTLTATPTSLSGFTTTAGTASTEQSYALSGSDLTGFPSNITVTAPTGYEVSLTSGSGFAASVNVPYTSASLASTTIYVRIASSASAGAANGNVSNAGGGATTVNVALTGTVNSGTPFTAIYEPFTGTGTLNTNNGWNSHSGTASQVQRVSGSLSYSGLQASTGDKIQILTSQSEDLNKGFVSVTSGTLYASFIVNVSDVSKFQLNTATGTYFAHFAEHQGLSADFTTFNFVSRLYVRQGSASDTYQLGLISKGGGTPTATDIYGASPTNLSENTTYFIVVKYDVASQTSSLYINPVPGAAEPTATYTSTFGTSVPTDIESICIRNSNSGGVGTGDMEIDELRIAKTWAEVTPPNTSPDVAVNPASLNTFITDINTASVSQSYVVSGSNLTDDIIITAPTGFEIKKSVDATYTSTITLTPTSGNVPNTSIDVRLAASNTNAKIMFAEITNVSGSFSKTVSLKAVVNATLANFADTPKNELASPQTYTFSAVGITEDLIISNNDNINYSLSKDGTTYTSTLTYTPAELSGDVTISVRFEPKSDVFGLKPVNVEHSSSTLTSVVSTEGKQIEPLALADELAAQVSVYPNPAKNILHVKAPKNYEIQVLDITSRKVANFKANETFDVSKLAGGVYFLYFNEQGTSFVKRLVIQK